MSKSESKPNPGSDEALDQGCTCPIYDNHHGQGFMGIDDKFVVNMDCPLHTVEEYQ